jgi:endo-1,4-beta-xylanase
MIVRTALLLALSILLSIPALAQERTLKSVFRDDFRVGAALSTGQLMGRNPSALELVPRQFNSVTAENAMKWGPLHPRPGVYNWEPADAFVDFGTRHGMFVVGHTLVWHSQTPPWVFQDENGSPAGRDVLIQRMRDHIHTVVGRYRGRVHGWDVVNEAVEEDGTVRRSPWLQIIGEDYLELAFRFAHEADPAAELYYNDFNAWKPSKRDGIVRLVRDLQARGVPVHAVGMQGHYGIDYPAVEVIDAAIAAYARLGVKVHVTELDIDVLPNPTGRQGSDIIDRIGPVEGYNPFPDRLPEVEDHRLAGRYAEIFRLFLRHSGVIERVTFWGVGDGDSWFNNWPIPGRTAYPLLFDRRYQPKTAFEVVLNTRLLHPAAGPAAGSAADPRQARPGSEGSAAPRRRRSASR